MQKFIQNLKWLTLSAVLGITIGGGLIAVNAWTEPTADPPGGNIGAPINTGINGQMKSGALQVNGLRNIGTTVLDGNVGIGTTAPTQKLDVVGYVKGTGVCIGADCRTAWPASGTSGSGTANYITKWTGGTSQGNSQMFDNGTNVGIGTASPAQKLDVAGNVRATDICTTAGKCLSSIASGGLSGYEIKTASSPGDSFPSATASCSAGKKVIGGGCGGSVVGTTIINVDKPLADGSGWLCRVDSNNYYDTGFRVQASAICVNP